MSDKLYEPTQTIDPPQLEQLSGLFPQQAASEASQSQGAGFDLTGLMPSPETPTRSVDADTDFSPPPTLELELELPDGDAPTSGKTQLTVTGVKTSGVELADEQTLIAHGNRGDRHRLQIEAWFDMSTGILVVSRYDTEESHTLIPPQHIVAEDYFSGSSGSPPEIPDYRNDSSATGEPSRGPLPLGKYRIFHHSNPGYWRLDFMDGTINDVVDSGPGEGRGQFRLHYPGGSLGCITTPKYEVGADGEYITDENNRRIIDEENAAEWQEINALIESADPFRVFGDEANASRLWSSLQHGTLNVTDGNLPPHVQEIIDNYKR